MTEDTNGNRQTDRAVTEQESTTEWTKEMWESLPGDPTPDDLGYEVSDWEQFETLDGTGQVMFLPNDEAEIKDAAFVVAENEMHLDLANHC